ncbi:hypothetical protein CVT24_011254 [Panaeolus cyanescens]|uniref:FHA domain-containing protein n=1 Tax=Panaeolus cyanescens TaxID=181874 RepID=A0A409VI64_9AGAR|nr:hypothetical protein CVT24_011254 [Panaeolus cyanescens]
MDTSGFDQVGRFGTLSLLKAGSATDESSVVTSFGVDTAPLTFGSATTCDVRLYYPDIEKLHCKIVFNEDRKAFLTIIGPSGVHIDGCQVYPHTSSLSNPSTSGHEAPQTTIPLTNHSIFEIHGKRFRFSYPPKEVRKAIFDTPPQQKHRALRLSMINSAEVFSPRPSKDPRENLRILQSPLKPAFMKSPSKLRPQTPGSPIQAPQFDDEDEDEQEEIVLVETNYPRVVEEEKDLVILEDAPLPVPATQNPSQPPVTPRRRSIASNALHRAVLIRSAQRAVIRAEKVLEEDLEEEAEVFGTVLEEDEDVIGDDEGLEQDDEIHDVHMRSPGEADEEYSEDSSTDDEEEQPRRPTEQQKSLWRKSLERMWPFRSSSPERPPEETNGKNVNDDDDNSEDEEEDSEGETQSDAVAALPNRSIAATPIRRPLGPFMTPQQPGARVFPAAGTSQAAPATGRFSLAGGEARRVIVQQPWKVKDLVVPAPGTPVNDSVPVRVPSVPVQSSPIKATPKLTLEEKKAIQERRRSAVRQPDNFFAGGIPGMSPSKAPSSSSTFGTDSLNSSPTKPAPTKGRPLDNTISEQEEKEVPSANRDSDEDPLDTQILMERMKNTVEDMKRRRSMATGGSTPQFPPPSFHPQTEVRPNPQPTRAAMAPRLSVGVGVPGLGPIKKLDFSAVSTTPVRKTYEPLEANTPKPLLSTPHTARPAATTLDDNSESEDAGSPQQELPAFSLLRPAAREEAASRKSVGGGKVSPPTVNEEEKEDKRLSATAPVEPVRKPPSRSRSKPPSTTLAAPATRTRSRSPQPLQEAESSEDVAIAQPAVTVEKPPSKAKTPATARRGRKAAATPDPEAADDADDLQTPMTGRRARKPRVEPPETVEEHPEPEVEAAPEPEPVVPKRGRPKKPASTDATSKIPAAKSATKSRSRVRQVQEEVEEQDPLDSYNVNGESEEAVEPPAPAPAPRARATKIPGATSRTRTTKKAVKEEEDAQPGPAALAPAKTSRSTRVNTTATPAATATKGRRLKTPASAPAATITDKGKENMSGTGSGSDLGGESEEALTKVRVSRTRGTTRKVATKTEEVAVEIPDAPVKATRAKATGTTRTVRSRTKTG